MDKAYLYSGREVVDVSVNVLENPELHQEKFLSMRIQSLKCLLRSRDTEMMNLSHHKEHLFENYKP